MKVTSFIQYKEGRLTGLDTFCLGHCLLKHIMGGKIKGRKDKEEASSNCWITLRE
jgi:hypothetical protein